VRTLRLYDELGLLKPAQVDRFSDYRYYAIDQLPRLNRILALKDLGLTLEQIGQLLNEPISLDQLRDMLLAKRADIEQQLAEERARLVRVEARLYEIEHERDTPAYDVVLKKVGEQTIAGVRQVVPHVEQMGDYRDATLRTLYDWLHAHGVQHTDTELMLYRGDEYCEENIDMEAAVVVPRGVAQSLPAENEQAVRIRTLPAVTTMASTVHHGSLYDIPRAIIAIFDWIGRSGYRSDGPIRELHLFGSEMDVTSDEDARQPRVLEIQLPVVAGAIEN
jgi:DNA-binding transcriptional MerR regulator